MIDIMSWITMAIFSHIIKKRFQSNQVAKEKTIIITNKNISWLPVYIWEGINKKKKFGKEILIFFPEISPLAGVVLKQNKTKGIIIINW